MPMAAARQIKTSPSDLYDILTDHGSRLSKVETTLESLHTDLGDIKKGQGELARAFSGMPREGQINTKTMLNSVSVAVALMTFMLSIVGWVYSAGEDKAVAEREKLMEFREKLFLAKDDILSQRITMNAKLIEEHMSHLSERMETEMQLRIEARPGRFDDEDAKEIKNEINRLRDRINSKGTQ